MTNTNNTQETIETLRERIKDLEQAAATHDNKHRQTLRQLLTELEQKHIYQTTASDAWDTLQAKLDSLTRAVHRCEDVDSIRDLMQQRDGINRRMQGLFIDAAYKGALSDTWNLPDTLDEIRQVLVLRSHGEPAPTFDI